MNVFEIDITSKGKYPTYFTLDLYRHDSNELIQSFNISYFINEEDRIFLDNINHEIKKNKPNRALQLDDYVDLAQVIENYIQNRKDVKDFIKLIDRKVCNEIQLIDKIKNILVHKFNTKTENIQLYQNENDDMSEEEKIAKNLNNSTIYCDIDILNRMIHMIREMTLIKIDNQFFIRRYIKSDSRSRVFTDMFNLTSNLIYLLICDNDLFDQLDDIFKRYNYLVASEECATELKYYLKQNYFSKLHIPLHYPLPSHEPGLLK